MNCSMPYMPRFEIVKVPSSRSGILSFPSRARATRSARAAAISSTDLRAGVADDRHDQAVVGGDGDADVDGRVPVDPPVDEERVDRRVTLERGGDEAREDVVDGRLRLALPQELDHSLPRRRELGRVRGHRQLEDRRLPGFGQAPRDRPPDRRELDDLDFLRRSGSRSRGRRSAVGRALDVLRDDPALGPGPGERCEIEPALARHPPGQRARLDRLAFGRDRSLLLRMLLARSVVGRGLAL